MSKRKRLIMCKGFHIARTKSQIMMVRNTVTGLSLPDIILLFYLIKELPRKRKKKAIKLFKKHNIHGYERLVLDSEKYNSTKNNSIESR